MPAAVFNNATLETTVVTWTLRGSSASVFPTLFGWPISLTHDKICPTNHKPVSYLCRGEDDGRPRFVLAARPVSGYRHNNLNPAALLTLGSATLS